MPWLTLALSVLLYIVIPVILAQLARRQNVHPSRLAHGVPLGGELEYVDRGTLSHAFGTRSEMPL